MRIGRMMIATLVFAALQLGCSDLEIATNTAETDALRKIKSGQYELIKTDKLAQLRKDAEIGRSVGRFQIHRQGWRTWRLDTATGASCLLLTTDADWKKSEIAAQSCTVQ